jgi:4-alpha-glucanotransferase
LAILPVQDLLELGSKDRMNIPGTPEGNWEWRLPEGALTGDLAQRLGEVTVAHNRLGKETLA